MKYGTFIIPSKETHILKVYSRIDNSYDYETTPKITFKGRPANNMETREYRVMKGVNGANSSVFVYCSNLPEKVKIGDKVEFLNQIWTIMSIGYYYDNTKIINAGIMSEDYIMQKSPKGINIQ